MNTAQEPVSLAPFHRYVYVRNGISCNPDGPYPLSRPYCAISYLVPPWSVALGLIEAPRPLMAALFPLPF